eukprot:4208590-Amphidinium_carterae.1
MEELSHSQKVACWLSAKFALKRLLMRTSDLTSTVTYPQREVCSTMHVTTHKRTTDVSDGVLSHELLA